MSLRKRYVSFADILRTIWFIEPSIAEGYYPIIMGMLEGRNQPVSMDDDSDGETKAKDEHNTNGELKFNSGIIGYRVSDYGEAAPPEQAPPNSVAIFDFKDVITKYDQYCGSSGMLTKQSLIWRAAANPNIVAFVFDVDSPGGDGYAAAMVTEAAKASGKPVVAHIQGMAASAGLWLVANCDHIMMDGKGSQIGSLGSYCEVWNFTEYYKQKGISIDRIYAPQSSLKNKSWEDALKKDDKALKDELKAHVDHFITDVKAGRPGLANDENIFKGKMYFTEESLANGLADSSGSLSDAIKKAYDLAQKSSTGTSNVNSNKNSNTMFGNKYPILHALVGKDTKDITAKELEAANAELIVNGHTSINLVSADDIAAAEKAVSDLAIANASLKKAEADLVTANATIETKNAEITALGNKSGDAHTTSTKTNEKTEESAGKTEAEVFVSQAHNKEALDKVKAME